MQDLEQLKEHQEYKLIKLMINGVARMVASNCINSGYEVYLEEATRNSITTMLKVFTGDSKEDYIRLMVFHFPSTNTVDISYASFENKKRVNYRELNKVDVNNLYNLLMQVINEVIPCQQQ